MKKSSSQIKDLAKRLEDLLIAFHEYKTIRQNIGAVLTQMYGNSPSEELRVALLQVVARMYEIKLVESDSPRNRGELTLDRKSPNFEAAKTGLRDLIAQVQGSKKRGGDK